jgi:hypothetical protein
MLKSKNGNKAASAVVRTSPPAIALGDTVVTRIDTYHPSDTNRDGLKIPATTVGVVMARVVGGMHFAVDFGPLYGTRYIAPNHLDIIDAPESIADFVEGITPGSTLVDLMAAQMRTIRAMQAKIDHHSADSHHRSKLHRDELAQITDERDQLLAQVEGLQAQIQGLTSDLLDAHRAPARLAGNGHRDDIEWLVGAVGDHSLEADGWCFGGEEVDPETKQVSDWRWFRAGSNGDGC